MVGQVRKTISGRRNFMCKSKDALNSFIHWIKVSTVFLVGYSEGHKKASVIRIWGAFWRVLRDKVAEVSFNQVI